MDTTRRGPAFHCYLLVDVIASILQGALKINFQNGIVLQQGGYPLQSVTLKARFNKQYWQAKKYHLSIDHDVKCWSPGNVIPRVTDRNKYPLRLSQVFERNSHRKNVTLEIPKAAEIAV